MPVTHQPAGSPQGGQFAPASGTTSGSTSTSKKTEEQIRDFQKRRGLQQTGSLNDATKRQINGLRDGSIGRAAAAGKAASKKAASDKKAADRKAAAAAEKAKRDAERAEAKLAKDTADALNRLEPAQRAAWLARNPMPKGHAVDRTGKVVPASRAAADDAVALSTPTRGLDLSKLTTEQKRRMVKAARARGVRPGAYDALRAAGKPMRRAS